MGRKRKKERREGRKRKKDTVIPQSKKMRFYKSQNIDMILGN